MTTSFYFPSKNAEDFNFSILLPILLVSIFSIIAILSSCEMVIHGFDLCFPND